VIFVDTNVLMYAVGRAHPLRDTARDFFREHVGQRTGLVTSAEVLQELMHAYVPVGRVPTLDSALTLVDGCFTDVWPVEAADVRLARLLIETHPQLDARDLLHVACCRRREVGEVFTFDRALEAAFRAG
jgi:predicted nucleic acid-binding protein